MQGFRKRGFIECAPLGDYQPDCNSTLMTPILRNAEARWTLRRKPNRTSHLHRPSLHAHGGLADGFAEGGMGVAGAGDVFG